MSGDLVRKRCWLCWWPSGLGRALASSGFQFAPSVKLCCCDGTGGLVPLGPSRSLDLQGPPSQVPQGSSLAELRTYTHLEEASRVLRIQRPWSAGSAPCPELGLRWEQAGPVWRVCALSGPISPPGRLLGLPFQGPRHCLLVPSVPSPPSPCGWRSHEGSHLAGTAREPSHG